MRIVDFALAVGASARLSRLVITDDLGQWWIKQPIDDAMDRYAANERLLYGHEALEPWWWKYRSGLDCPFCVGFWLGAGVLVTGAVAASHPRARSLWRFGAGALALNYVAAHLGSRLGDFEEDED